MTATDRTPRSGLRAASASERTVGDYGPLPSGRGSVERGWVERGSVERGSVERGSVERGSVERGSVERGSVVCDQRGFTLLEVMVALAILGLALTAILSAQAGLYSANVQARNLTQATSAGRCKMNELEVELLSKGYPETDQNGDGPCCGDDSPAGISCRWQIERVTLPDPPKTNPLGDGGVGGDGGAGGMGPLGALAGAAANPGALGDGGLSALSSSLAAPMGPGGQTGVSGVAGLAMNIVYPQLKPLLESSIRRVTLDVVWNEGPVERKLRLVQFITNPNKGLPPMLDPSMAGGLPGAAGTTTGGVVAPTPIGGAAGASPTPPMGPR